MSLIKFNNNAVRTNELNKELWFCVKDACEIVEIANYRDAIKDIPSHHVRVVSTDTNAGKRNMSFVSEAGLYSIIFKSRKDEAERFKWFIFETVIPEYRRNQERLLESAIHERDDLIAEQQSTIEAYEELHNESGSMCMREATIIMKEYFYDVSTEVGRNSLFEFLRQNGVLDDENIPYQKFADKFVSLRENGNTTIRLKNTKLPWLKKFVAKRIEKRFVSRKAQHLLTTFKF